jgi:hypothetical protein
VHHPGKVVTDLAVTLALGGDCLADVAVLRSESGIYGRVASMATVSRTITALATDADRVLAGVAAARKAARTHAWELAGLDAPNHAVTADDPLVVDLDATLVTAPWRRDVALMAVTLSDDRPHERPPGWAAGDNHGAGVDPGSIEEPSGLVASPAMVN